MRSFTEVLDSFFAGVGLWLGTRKRAPFVLLAGLLVPALLAIAIKDAAMETRIEKLWIESGGRLEQELDFLDANLPKDPAESRGSNVLLTTANPEGDDVLTAEVLGDHLELLKAIGQINVTMNGFNWQLSQLCHKVEVPIGFTVSPRLIPCTRISILDCFAEGGFDFVLEEVVKLVPLLNESYGIQGFGHLPRFKDPNTNIKRVVRGGCSGYATQIAAMFWPEDLLIGGVTRAPGVPHSREHPSPIVKAEALETIILLSSAEDIAAREAALTEAHAEQVLFQWRTQFLALVPSFQAARLTHSRNHVLASDSFDRLLADVSSASAPLIIAGYAIMIVFVVVTLRRERLAIAGLCGLGMCALATLGSFGFTTLLGVTFNATSTQVLPFIALGIGVDDMFVLAHTLAAVRNSAVRRGEHMSRARQISETMRIAGPSISTTSLANFCAFMSATVIPLPAVVSFCYQAAAVVAFNYFTLVVSLPAAMSLLGPATPGRAAAGVASGGGGSGAGGAAAGTGFGTASAGVSAQYEQQQQQAEATPVENGTAAKGDDGGDTDRNDSVVVTFARRHYAPAIASGRGKLVVGALSAIFIVLAGYGASVVESGIDIEDVAPAGSSEFEFLRARFAYFAFFDGSLITEPMDYPAMQRELLDTVEALRANPYVSSVPEMWLESFIRYVNDTCCLDNDGLVPKSSFYFKMNRWLTSDESAMDAIVSGAEFFAFDDDLGLLQVTTSTFYISEVATTAEFVDLIKSVRAVCDDSPVPCFPTGIPFSFWEQYVHLLEFLLEGMGWSLLAVFLVTAAMMQSLLGALLVCAMLGLSVFEVYGAMGLAGIKMSAIPGVSLIMALGVAVEFTAHLILAFLKVGGTRKQRVTKALEHMFAPILDGGLSTFVGIFILAFSQFGFIRKYFFGVFVAVSLMGLFNGLAVLPVLLEFVGPRALPGVGSDAQVSDSDSVMKRGERGRGESVEAAGGLELPVVATASGGTAAPDA